VRANHTGARCVRRVVEVGESSTHPVHSRRRPVTLPIAAPSIRENPTAACTAPVCGNTPADLRRRRLSTVSTAPTTPTDLYMGGSSTTITRRPDLGMTSCSGPASWAGRAPTNRAGLPRGGAAWQDAQSRIFPSGPPAAARFPKDTDK
jgi:hypothetical protein